MATISNDKQNQEVPSYLKIGKIVTYGLYALVIFAEILLAFRIFLLAFSANADTPFVRFVYETSGDFLDPFRGIFPPRAVGETGYLDVAALFAMIVYGLIAWGFSALIGYIASKIAMYETEEKPAPKKK
jgi:uncharacterized protein YggT (Ycf19 family)